MNGDFEALLAASRVTAFVDILGWGVLTSGSINDILRKTALAAEGGEQPMLTSDERQRLSEYEEHLKIARRIDREVQHILKTLRDWMVPETVGGRTAARQARNFWGNRHATFVRVSDCIFMQSTSFSILTAVVSELLKRGLKAGVLMRAGLSLGYVMHVDHPSPPDVDVRSHDISLYGSGMTSAVKAESSARKTGVRTIVHPQLTEILHADGGYELLESHCGTPPNDIVEFPWWRDQWRVGMSDQDRERLTAWSQEDVVSIIDALRSSPLFTWNRCGEGQLAVDDTLLVLQQALIELSSSS